MLDIDRHASLIPSNGRPIFKISYRFLNRRVWVLFVTGVILALFVTKWIQRYVEGEYQTTGIYRVMEALVRGIRGRLDDISFYVTLSAAASMLIYQYATRLHFARSGIRGLPVGKKALIAWALVTSVALALYLATIKNNPDPGTFYANSTGIVKFLHVIGGIIDVAMLVAGFFWIAVASILSRWSRTEDQPQNRRSRRIDGAMLLLLPLASAAPALVYLAMFLFLGKDFLDKGWADGNYHFSAIGFAIVLLASFLYPTIYILIRRDNPAPDGPPTTQERRRLPPTRETKDGVEMKVVILFLAANPSDATRLALTREVQNIDDDLRATIYRDRFRLEQQWETQARQIPGKIMRFGPQIVHFSGHGSEAGELVLQDEQGRAMTVSQKVIADVFGKFRDSVQCVVLNACYSESQAKTIAEHIPVVIGMSDEIGDDDARAFARAFYEALGYRRSYGDAFDLAKLAIPLSGYADADLPVLLKRSDIDPNKLFPF